MAHILGVPVVVTYLVQYSSVFDRALRMCGTASGCRQKSQSETALLLGVTLTAEQPVMWSPQHSKVAELATDEEPTKSCGQPQRGDGEQ